MSRRKKEALSALLNKRVDVERPVTASDGGGGFTQSWQLVATVWAGVTPLRGREDFDDFRLASKVNYRFIIRHRDGIEPKMRINYGNRIFNIRAVMNIDEENKTLELLAEEGVAT